MMQYQEFIPDIKLQPYVKCLWSLSGTVHTTEPERIFPDGCMELVFHFGDAFTRVAPQPAVQPKAILVGQLDTALQLQPGKQVDVLAVRFFPWGAYPFVQMPLHRLTAKEIAMDALWGSEGTNLYQRLAETTPQQRLLQLQQFLLQQLTRPFRVNPHIALVTRFVQQQKGNVKVEDLAFQSHLSIRQFTRNFSEAVGLSPKTFARIIRFQQFFKEMEQYPGEHLTTLAQRCGYYDQAHFIRDFKGHTGLTPKLFFDDQGLMTRFFLD